MKLARLVSIVLFLFGLGCELTLGRLAPFDGPLGELDSHLEGQVGPGRSLACVRLDRAQMRERALLARPHRTHDVDPPLGQAVREEQLQHSLVAELVGRLVVGLEPALQRRRARFGQLVDGARAAARRLRSPAHEALILQALELGIDLPVARRPEVARRLVYERLDVVAGALTERDHAEDDAAGRAHFDGWWFGIRAGHVSGRYISPRHISRRAPLR